MRSIVITGCSSGIGAFCAQALKRDGWRVFATARKPEDIERLASEGFEALYLDYREPDSIAAAIDTVLERTGGSLDALFNNGAYGQAGAVEDLPVDALREQLETNVIGWHDLTRRVIPVMRRQGHGRIVHCSSILGLLPLPWRGAYCASKYALEGLMMAMRMELAGSGIHVSMIEPGAIESRFRANGLAYFRRHIDIEGSVHAAEYQQQLKRLTKTGPTSRFTLGPDAVHAKLVHALTAPRPRPHYVVTVPARVSTVLKRLMPAAAFYRFLANRA